MASEKDVWLIYGSRGWIGGQLAEMLEKEGETVVRGQARLENRESIAAELKSSGATKVLNAAGLTGRPNVDWCEDHKEEVVRVNVCGTVTLVDEAKKLGLKVTNFATGCIYEYDAEHPLGSGKGFTELEPPNFTGSFYSYTKDIAEKLLKPFDNVLTLRLRMPISDDLSDRSFITKITRYQKVVNIPNSMSVLHDLLPVSLKMARQGLVGVYNFTNPGVISHNEILDLYIQYIDPSFKYTNFTLEEQAQVIKAPRSNNELDSTKLVTAFPEVPHIKESIQGVFQRMKVNLGK